MAFEGWVECSDDMTVNSENQVNERREYYDLVFTHVEVPRSIVFHSISHSPFSFITPRL